MRFPLNPPRGLALTSPLTHGQDVTWTQQAINIWARAHGLPTVAEDGTYGPDTDHAFQVVAFDMGLRYLRPMRATIRLVWHPWLRTPADLLRATQRAKQRPKGVAALPGIAARYIGVHENPSGSNRGEPFPSRWERNFGMDGVSWCGCYAGSMILEAGGHVTSRVAYVPFIEQDARARVNGFDAWTTDHGAAGPGWLVIYAWSGGVPDHVGIVESFTPGGLVAVEGNTSGTNPQDGGMVARMHRGYSPVVGYAKPRL